MGLRKAETFLTDYFLSINKDSSSFVHVYPSATSPFFPLHQTTTVGQAHLCHQTSEVKGTTEGQFNAYKIS